MRHFFNHGYRIREDDGRRGVERCVRRRLILARRQYAESVASKGSRIGKCATPIIMLTVRNSERDKSWLDAVR